MSGNSAEGGINRSEVLFYAFCENTAFVISSAPDTTISERLLRKEAKRSQQDCRFTYCI